MLERLNQTPEHIESHLDRRIDVAGPARIATTSEYHLRRMFSALTGMPLSEYIRRRRLTVAGSQDASPCWRSRCATAMARARPGAPVPRSSSSPG